MQTVHQSLLVRLSTAPPPSSQVDILFVPVFEKDDLTDLPDLDAATGGEVGRARARGEFIGKPWELFVTPLLNGGWKAGRIGLIGAGPVEQWNGERARRAATVAGLTARQRRSGRVAILHRPAGAA